jgi:hypothetical protein
MHMELMASPRAHRAAARLTAIALATGGACVSHAATIELEGSVGVGYSDNITRAESNKESATIGSLGLQFDIAEQTRRLEGVLTGDLEWLNYSGDAFSSEVIGNAAGRASLSLIEERLSWTLEDSFGQTRRDMFSAPSPGNRELVNFLATGPDLRLPIGNVTDLRLEGRYTRVDYEHSPADSQRYGATIALDRELSSTTRASLNASHQRIDPRNADLLPEYDRSSAFLRYAITGARSSISFDAGADRVEGDGLDTSGALLRLELSRQLGVYSRITARLGNEITDPGAAFGQQGVSPVPTGTPGTDALMQDVLPYTNRYVELGWSAEGLLTSLGVWASVSDEDYKQAGAFDRRRYSVDLRGSRDVAPRTSVSAGVNYQRYAFDAPLAPDNEDITYHLGVDWSVNPRLGLKFSAERSQYSSNSGEDFGDEMRFWLRLTYGRASIERASP